MTVSATAPRRGFMLFESILALLLFSMVGVALVSALNQIGDSAYTIRREGRLARLLDSELRAAMSYPILEEGETVKELEEFNATIRTIIEPLPEIENQDGQLLQQMYRIEVQATWYENNETQEMFVETWRYAPLYRQ